MSRMVGADPAALDRMAGVLRAASRSMTSTGRRLNPLVQSSPWTGRNADRFRHQWNSEYRRAIDDAARFLSDGATHLTRQAEEQRRISGADAGGRLTNAGRLLTRLFERLRAVEEAIGVVGLMATLGRWGRSPLFSRHLRSFRDAWRSGTRLANAGGQTPARILRSMGSRGTNVFRSVRFAKRILGPISALLTLDDARRAFTDMWTARGDGRWREALYQGYLGAYRTAGLVPIVGLAQTAWTVGTGIGGWLGQHAAAESANSLLRSRLATEPTPSQIAELNMRYSGISGWKNIAVDATINVVKGW